MDTVLNREQARKKGIEWLAKARLIAKDCVYILLGNIALMTALHIGGQSSAAPGKYGIFQLLDDSIASNWLLPILAVGLLCYSIWRCIEAVRVLRNNKKHYQKAARYYSSAGVYLF